MNSSHFPTGSAVELTESSGFRPPGLEAWADPTTQRLRSAKTLPEKFLLTDALDVWYPKGRKGPLRGDARSG